MSLDWSNLHEEVELSPTDPEIMVSYKINHMSIQTRMLIITTLRVSLQLKIEGINKELIHTQTNKLMNFLKIMYIYLSFL